MILAIAAGLISAGNYYNSFSDRLAKATNELVVLPKVKEVPFRLGLDLQGGTQLTYQADVKNVASADRRTPSKARAMLSSVASIFLG